LKHLQLQASPIHFEDFSGQQFERLCFAYLLRRPEFKYVNWYGQLGKDGGQDIVCSHEDGSIYIYQCANYKKLAKKKAEDDLKKLAKNIRSRKACFHLVVGGTVSGQMKDSIVQLAKKAGFVSCEVWSGIEFEERLRKHTPDVFLRFVQGVEFPESPQELVDCVADIGDKSDEIIISALTIAFDRPAFKTRFHHESSLPRFRNAIIETIQTLNTGITSSGRVLPSKNNVSDIKKREALDKLIARLVALRASFEELIRTGEIQPCKCDKEDCPVYMLSEKAIKEMDDRRTKMLFEVNKLNSDFSPLFYNLE
jgi:hypothetical protein